MTLISFNFQLSDSFGQSKLVSKEIKQLLSLQFGESNDLICNSNRSSDVSQDVKYYSNLHFLFYGRLGKNDIFETGKTMDAGSISAC